MTINKKCIHKEIKRRLYSAGLDDQGSIPSGGSEFFSKPPRPERLWGPPSLLSNG